MERPGVEEVKMTIGADGKVMLHFEGMKAEVRHGLAKELEKLIGPATYRKHGPPDKEINARIDQDIHIHED
jgi:hypothetical protein